MRDKSKFQKGSGCYKCTVCGRQTRSTGRGDNENLRQCAECYEVGGIENQILDSPNDPDVPKWQAEIEALNAVVVAKGDRL